MSSSLNLYSALANLRPNRCLIDEEQNIYQKKVDNHMNKSHVVFQIIIESKLRISEGKYSVHASKVAEVWDTAVLSDVSPRLTTDTAVKNENIYYVHTVCQVLMISLC